MNVVVNMLQPDGSMRQYEIPETAMQIVVSWAGSVTETARLLGRTTSSVSTMISEYPCMREMIGNRYTLTQQMALEGMQGAIADAIQVQQYWTRVMYDPTLSESVRLNASIQLAKALGMFIERKEVEHRHEEAKRHRSIDERLKMLQDVQEVPAWAR